MRANKINFSKPFTDICVSVMRKPAMNTLWRVGETQCTCEKLLKKLEYEVKTCIVYRSHGGTGSSIVCENGTKNYNGTDN